MSAVSFIDAAATLFSFILSFCSNAAVSIGTSGTLIALTNAAGRLYIDDAIVLYAPYAAFAISSLYPIPQSLQSIIPISMILVRLIAAALSVIGIAITRRLFAISDGACILSDAILRSKRGL